MIFNVDTFWERYSRVQDKLNDKTTTQLVVDGEGRGQLERYYRAISAAMTETLSENRDFIKFLESGNVHDVYLPYENKDWGMDYKIREDGGSIAVDKRKRRFFDELPIVVKFRGSVGYMRWLTQFLFGWYVEGIISLSDDVLKLNTFTSTLYDGVGAGADFDKLFDPATHTPVDMITLRVNYFSDPDILLKMPQFRSYLERKWLLGIMKLGIQFIPDIQIAAFWDASGGLPPQVDMQRYICSVAGNGWTKNHIYEWRTAKNAWLDINPPDKLICYVVASAGRFMYLYDTNISEYVWQAM